MPIVHEKFENAKEEINTVASFEQLREVIDKLKKHLAYVIETKSTNYDEVGKEAVDTDVEDIFSRLKLSMQAGLSSYGIAESDTGNIVEDGTARTPELLDNIKEYLNSVYQNIEDLTNKGTYDLEDDIERGFLSIAQIPMPVDFRQSAPRRHGTATPPSSTRRDHTSSRASTSRGEGASEGGIGLSEEMLARCRVEIEEKVNAWRLGNKRDGIPPQVLEKWDYYVAHPDEKFAKVYINKVLSIPGWVRSGEGPWTKEVTIERQEVDFAEDGITPKKDGKGRIALKKVLVTVCPYDENDEFKYMTEDDAKRKLILARALAQHSGLEGDDIGDFFEYIIKQRRAELASYGQSSKAGHVRPDTFKRQAICLDGPPGTGKTSIAQIAARILGIGYYAKTVAGQRGGHFIYGRGPEWESPELGLVAQAMAETHRRQVLILSDEAEKATDTDLQMAYGDVLESNAETYKDALLQCDFYKPTALHLLTTNRYELLAEHIQSRVAYKRIGGYTPEVKKTIAYNKMKKEINKKADAGELNGIFLIPITPLPVDHPEEFVDSSEYGDFDALDYIIENYSVEQGVRELGAMIDQIMQELTSSWIDDGGSTTLILDKDLIHRVLGEPNPKVKQFQEASNKHGTLMGEFSKLSSSLNSYRSQIVQAMDENRLDEELNRILHGDSGPEVLEQINSFLSIQKDLREFLPGYIILLNERLALASGEKAESIRGELEAANQFMNSNINQVPLLLRLAVERPDFTSSISGLNIEEILSADLKERERVADYERKRVAEIRRKQEELAFRLREGTLLDDLSDLGDLELPSDSGSLREHLISLEEQTRSLGGEGSLDAIRRLFGAISRARDEGRLDEIPDDLYDSLNVERGNVEALIAKLKDRAGEIGLDAQRERERELKSQQEQMEELRRLTEQLREKGGSSPRRPKSRASSHSSGSSSAATPSPGPSEEADGARQTRRSKSGTPPLRRDHERRMGHSSSRDERRGSPLSSGRTSDPDAAFEATFTESRRVSSSYLSGRRDSSRPATLKYELSKLVTDRMNFASDSAGNPEIVGMTKAPKNRSLDDSWSDIAGNTARFLEQANHDDLGDGDWVGNAYDVYKGWEVTGKDDTKFTSVYSKDGSQVAKVDYAKQDGAVKARASLDGFADPDVADKAIAQMLEVATRVYLETGKNKVNLNGLQDRPDLAVKFMEAAALLAQKDIKLKIVFDAPTVEAVMSNPKSAERVKDIAKIDPSGAEIVKESVNHEVVEPDSSPRHDRRGMR